MATHCRLAREARGILQQQMARDIVISQSLLSYIESGEKEPTPEIAAKIALYLGLEIHHLFPELRQRSTR